MVRHGYVEAVRLEAELRSRLTQAEYGRLVKQLEGALAGITLLRARAPQFLDHFLESTDLVRTDNVTEDAREALSELIGQLREAHEARPRSGVDVTPKKRAHVLRLVKHSTRNR